MKLYYVVGSPNCRKVHGVLNHTGTDVRVEYLDHWAKTVPASPDLVGRKPKI